jgi:uncharacterized membrane protein YfcA
VDWATVKAMIPGLLAGVIGGAAVARFMKPGFLKYFFIGFMTLVAIQLVFNLRPKASRELPGRGGLTALGAVIGVCSSWFGGGAAAVGVPFLTWCNVSAHRAIGTVAALGFPTSIAGAIGYAVAGFNAPGLPPWSLGFVYLPAAIGISVTSLLLAPLGARLAHRLKGPTLRRIFALFILAVAAKLAFSAEPFQSRMRVRKSSTDCSRRVSEHHSSVWWASVGSPGPRITAGTLPPKPRFRSAPSVEKVMVFGCGRPPT